MLLAAHPSYVGGMMIISCSSFQNTACTGGREGDAAAVQQLGWHQPHPRVPSCWAGGWLPAMPDASLLPAPQECEGGETSFVWRDIMSKKGGAD